MSLGAGVAAALAGAGAAYGFGIRQRSRELDYAAALALANELFVLTSELEQLAQKASAGPITEAERLAVRGQAERLMGRVPAGRLPKSGTSAGDALAALRQLIVALDASPSKDLDEEAVRLRRAKKEVTMKVSMLVGELSERAAKSMSFSGAPPTAPDGPEVAPPASETNRHEH